MVSILHREMRLVSKRRWTFIGRILTTVLGFLLCLVLVFASSGQGGAIVFNTLAFFSFAFCLIQGVRRASGMITEEKREGTLGLLFLTPLKPRDIIGGKFFSVAIPMIQPLLAFLPVLSISILLGGTTWGELLRSILVLGSVLVLSISTGLFVSSWSRDTNHSGRRTLLLLLAAVFIPVIFGRGILDPLRYFTPWTAYRTISDPGYRVNGEDFWLSIITTNAFSLLALLGATFFLPRRFEEKEIAQIKTPALDRKFSQAERAAILDRNPGEWLAVRSSIGRVKIWIMNGAMLVFGGVAIYLTTDPISFGGAGIAFVPLAAGSLILILPLASQSSYPLSDARRSGAIDLLVSTPLNPSSLIKGQITALLRQFGPPFLILFVAGCASIAIAIFSSAIHFALIPVFIYGCVVFAGIVSSVVSMGMWMGLREKTPNSAFFRTLLWGFFIPSILGNCGVAPLSYLAALAVAASQITGRDLRRLLKLEKKEPTPTPRQPPIIPAAPRG